MYSPLDKDIVREMWVKGDLKDQLGLSHRKARKNKNTSDRNLEAAPMFRIHERSLSELSTIHHNYEPANANSPPFVAATGKTTYLDTPPMNDTIELPPREPRVQYTQSMIKPSDSHVSPPTTDLRFMPSPQPSYYSVSDIPPSSPLPSPKYQLPSGEITTTPPSRRSSIATSRATSVREAPQAHIPTIPQSSNSISPNNSLSIPHTQKRTSAGYSGVYEMQAYDEQAYGLGSARSASETSFATADDFWPGEKGDTSPNYAYQHTQMLHTPQQLDFVTQPQLQSHATSQADNDDRSTIVGDSRRGSTASSAWEGGRAV